MKLNIIEKIKTLRQSKYMSSTFLGKQLSRLKMGQSYASIVLSAISAASLLTLAFGFEQWILIAVFPVAILIAFFAGYYLDTRNINSIDALKSNEMVHRFLSTSDIKNQEFQMMMTKTLLEAISKMQKNEKVDLTDLEKNYEEYLEKWKSPPI